METIYHLIGMCPDAHSHFDLLDIIAIWDSFISSISRFYILIIKFKFIIFNLFK